MIRLVESNAAKAAHDKIGVEWRNSPLGWIKDLQIKAKGSLFENFVEEVYKANGHTVERPDDENANYDLIIDGKKVEVKGATRAFSSRNGKDTYKINQIRPKQDYELLVFLLIDPTGWRLYEVNKKIYMREDASLGIRYQHSGGEIRKMSEEDKAKYPYTLIYTFGADETPLGATLKFSGQ